VRRIRYCCAVSLDGCIAGPGGEFDWIVMDPEMDFAALSGQFDTYLVGRKTFEINGGRDESVSGVRTFVFSRTPESERLQEGHDRQRRLEGAGSVSPRRTGEGHLAIRRRVALPNPRRGRTRRHGRGRGHSDDTRRGRSACRRTGFAHWPDPTGASGIREDGHGRSGLLGEPSGSAIVAGCAVAAPTACPAFPCSCAADVRRWFAFGGAVSIPG